MDILGELHDGLFLFGGGLALLLQIQMPLVDLRLFLSELFTELIHPLHLALEDLLKVEELIFEVFDPLLLGLQRGTHLCRAMCQHMLRLLQVLYLELVLVQVSLPLLELLSDLQAFLFKHVDLFDLLLKLGLNSAFLVPCDLHQLLLLTFLHL